MPSVNAYFNKYFKEQLAPLGFVKLKGLNAFGRLINNELMHYIILTNRSSLVRGKKAFTVSAGIYSIYSFTDLSYEYDKYAFINRGLFLLKLAPKRKPEQENVYKDASELQWINYEYLYEINNEKDITDGVNECYLCVEEYVIPFLDKITDIKSYVEYCKEYRPYLLYDADKLPDNDSLLLIKLNDHDDMIQIYEKYCGNLLESVFNENDNPDEYKREKELYYEVFINQIAKARDKVYDDPVLYKKTMETLENRKQTGKTVFTRFGIKVCS